MSQSKSTRKYDNSQRAAKSIETRQKIIETLVQLLVERRGADVSMEEIAQHSGITQRTIFRFFKDKKTLHAAMDDYLLTYLRVSSEQMKALDFIGFAQNAFALFDRNESLTLAYLFSPFGQEARVLFRKKLTQAMISKIVDERKIKLTPQNLKKLALITSLVNAKIWHDIKIDFNLTGPEIGETVKWALDHLLKDLEKSKN